MATKNIVPRANNEGGIGTSAKRWANGYFTDINASGDLSVTGTITGDVTGDVTGNVTGDLTGNVTGNVTGDVTGDVTGNVTGNADTATNATNDSLGNNIANTYQPAVVGAVIAFAGSTSPAGWLLCDGSAVSRTDYAALFAVIGTTYGAGDGTDTFNLPDLVDKFIQGNAVAGTEHSAGLPNITGEIQISRGTIKVTPTIGAFVGSSIQSESNLSCPTYPEAEPADKLSFNANESNPIYGNSTTVQPPSLTMRYIIKY